MGADLCCEACGNIQHEGDWEKAMDEQAKARGSKGFLNLGAEPQCLKCGSRELRDASSDKAREEELPEIVTQSAEEIVRIMEPYFKGGDGYIESLGGKERVRAIGQALYDSGGHSAMLAAFKEARNLAHRRFAYPGSARLLEMTWNMIGDWWG